MTPVTFVFSYSDDFSAEKGWKKRHFIHEMMHVLQSQNGNYNWLDGPYFAVRYFGDYGHAYPYSMDDLGKELCSFNFEQQADIVADYFTGRIPEEYREKAWETIDGFDTQGNKPIPPNLRNQTGTKGPFSPR